MMKKLVVAVSCLFLVSASSDLQKKYIRSGDYDIECYVSINKLKHYAEGRIYYWYKAGDIHQSRSRTGGDVLHNTYTKYYKSKQLAEQGVFDYGLKDGDWRTWYENGNPKTIIQWKKGRKQGTYVKYKENGALEQTGFYKANKKVKTWINHISKDTVFYKGDSSYVAKPKTRLKKFLERTFRKRDSLEKLERQLKRQEKRKADSLKRITRRLERQKNKSTKNTKNKT